MPYLRPNQAARLKLSIEDWRTPQADNSLVPISDKRFLLAPKVRQPGGVLASKYIKTGGTNLAQKEEAKTPEVILERTPQKIV